MTDPKPDSLDGLAQDDRRSTEATDRLNDTTLDDLDSGLAEVRTGDAGKISEDEAGDVRPAPGQDA